MASQNPPQKRLSVSEKIANNPTKRPHLSLSEKYEVVKKVEATGNKSSVARYFNLKPQSVDYIMSQASKIKEKYEENPVVAKYRKSFKGAEVGLELDKPLYEWFVNARSANKNIDTALLLKTAKHMASSMKLNVNPSISWVARWRKRFGINSALVCGESADCPDYSAWLDAHKELILSYDAADIINMDETALFWRMESNHTYVTSEEKSQGVRGRKINKSRVTILTGICGDGRKLPLIAIGSAKKPRWPKPPNSLQPSCAPITYYSSKKGWMTTKIMKQILSDLEMKCTKTKKKTLVLLDNCPAHGGFESLYTGVNTFIRILMLPKNTTSKLQPCDQGCIRSLKAHYRRRLTGLVMHKEAKDVSLYEKLLMFRAAWTMDVSDTVVRNAWAKSGLLACEAGECEESEKPLNSDKTDLDALADKEDNEVIMEAATSDPDIIVDRIINEKADAENDWESDDEESGIPLPAVPTTAEARKMIDHLKAKFIAAYGEIPDSLLDVENRINHIPSKQATLDNWVIKAEDSAL